MTFERQKEESPETIVIVDDTADNLVVLKKVLQRGLADTRIELFQDPEEALAFLTQFGASLAIIDIQMPKMNGIELCERLKGLENPDPIQVLLITSHDANPGLKVKGLDCGADDFILRPIDNIELQARVKAALRVVRAEKKLRKEAESSKADYDQLFRKMVSGCAVHDILLHDDGQACTHHFVAVNPAFERLLALDGKDIIGKTVTDVLPDLDKKLTDMYQTMIRCGNSIDLEEYSSRLDAYYEISAFLLEDNRFATIFRDITARKKAEKNLVRFSQILEHSMNEIYLFDADGFRFLMVNNGARQNLGYSNEELLALTPLDLKPEFTETSFIELVAPLRTGERQVVEFKTIHRRKNGTTYPIEVHLQYIGDCAPVFFAIILDISERERNEERLRTAQKLESIGLLAGGIAHDFNNIMSGLSLNLEIARSKMENNHPSTTCLETAQQAVETASNLTRQLLTFARGGDPVLSAVNIQDAIRQTTDFNLKGSNIKPCYDLPDHLWAVAADRGQLDQVIANLVINAKQAMPKGGNLYISAENIADCAEHPDCRGHAHCVKFVIRDEGGGIPKELQDKIFDPYFTTKETGTGLGLSTTLSIIHKHKGSIRVTSAPGSGTAFSIYLPTDPNRKVQDLHAKNPTKDRELLPARILIMDDEVMVTQALARILVNVGCETETAHDGKKAIQKYTEARQNGTPFDLVIMDLIVPGGMGGKEMIAKLLALDPDAIAIVASGYSSDPVLAHYSDYGFAGRLQKPFSAEELTNEIKRVLGR